MLELILLIVIVFLVGELWGRETPVRGALEREVTQKKADLESAKRKLASDTTSAFLPALIMLGVFVLIVVLLGGGRDRFWDDDLRDYHRSSHRYR